MQDDTFEWDDAKAAGNLRKHGVSFVDCRLVFGDAFAIERPDDRVEHGEDRSIVTGMANGRLTVVIYTERNGRIRIISGRKASRQERDDHYLQQASR
ncbi:MAG TPA: BrnT family toxin [Rhizomicrobium sp.]